MHLLLPRPRPKRLRELLVRSHGVKDGIEQHDAARVQRGAALDGKEELNCPPGVGLTSGCACL
mgnify:CR=1 FL=1